MAILTVNNLTKRFDSKTVVEDLSFTVAEHSIFGFLGPNGSGKTTTMNMILGLLKPTNGTITVCGESVTYGETKTNRFVGYLPDVPQFYDFMNAYEYLKLCGEITGLSTTEVKRKSDELLTLVGLNHEGGRVGSFSRGMKQRLGIAQALLNEPRLLICDEPTSALDPIGRKQILDILHEVKGKTTVVFSTHVLSDVERICDTIAVLHEGKIALSGKLSDIKTRHQQESLHVAFRSVADKNRFCSMLAIQPYLGNAVHSEKGITITTVQLDLLEKEILASLVAASLLPMKLEVLEPTLENIFMDVVK